MSIISRLPVIFLLCSLVAFGPLPACAQTEADTVAAPVIDTAVYHQPESNYDDEKLITTHFDTLSSVKPVKARTVGDSTITTLKKDNDYWYADRSPEKEKPRTKEQTNDVRMPQWGRTLLWVLMAAVFIGALVWFLASGNIDLFRKKPQRRMEAGDAEDEEDIFALPYEKEIAAAIAAGQYRLAIRLLYLRTLKDLAEKNIIQYRQDKTNSDYLMQLWDTHYYKSFFNLTRTFEYAWYGQQEPGAQTFEVVRNKFDQFKSGLQS